MSRPYKPRLCIACLEMKTIHSHGLCHLCWERARKNKQSFITDKTYDDILKECGYSASIQ